MQVPSDNTFFHRQTTALSSSTKASAESNMMIFCISISFCRAPASSLSSYAEKYSIIYGNTASSMEYIPVDTNSAGYSLYQIENALLFN